MDKRAEKTKNKIINTFIQMRRKKDIEKITIIKLTTIAEINKATFYHYYKDIYDLSEQIENELIADCISSIESIDIVSDELGFLKLANSFLSKTDILNIIFSGSRTNYFIPTIHKLLMEKIYYIHPEFKNDLEKNIILSTIIYGTFNSFFIYKDTNFDLMMKNLAKINKHNIMLLKQI